MIYRLRQVKQKRAARQKYLSPALFISLVSIIMVVSGCILTTHKLSDPAFSSTALRRRSASSGNGNTVNMLSQNWNYMPGVTQSNQILDVQPTDFKIVKQDGSGGQANPPLNLYGSRLQVRGDFTVALSIADNKGDASLQLYDTPPVIADEFRVEPASIRLTEENKDLHVQVFDGTTPGDVTAPQPVYSQHFALTDNDTSLTLTRSGNDLAVSANGTTVATMPYGRIFKSGALWFGLDSSNGGFTVTTLTASGKALQVVDTSQIAAVNTAGGLQALASAIRPGFLVGAAVAEGPLVSDPTYQSELLGNFGAITAENAMKAEFISPKQGVYDFQAADALIAIAQKNGLSVHGHNIAFSEAEPAWMRNLPTATAADRQSTSQILLDYARTYMTHFKGKLASIDVVNEPLDTDDGPTLQANVWSRALGANWMTQLSQLVYSIDPNVKQYINENGAEAAGDRQDALYNLVTSINAQGGHIYGVGLQAHVYVMDTDAINSSDLNLTINRFAAAGLKTRISEMDVTDDSGTSLQAQQYKDVFMTCLGNPNCVSFTTWGVDDKYDVFQDDDLSLQYGNDLLLDHGMQTPGYKLIVQSLQK